MGQTADAVLAWEAAEVQHLTGAHQALYLIPGGQAGFHFLVDRGVLGSAARVPVSQGAGDPGVGRQWGG